MSERRSRRGFVLVSVLAVLSVVGVVALGTVAEARLAVAATTNRTVAVRARWLARGCLAEARAATDAALAAASEGESRDRAWRDLKGLLDAATSSWDADCEISAEPSGVRADANTIDSAALVRLLELKVGTVRAEEIAAGILDWRDEDVVPRAGGAEEAWYAAAGRFGPSDREFGSDGELSLVKGLSDEPELVALLSTQSGPIAILHAPEAVVRALVGEDVLVVENILRNRVTTARITDLRDLLASPDTSIDRRGANAYASLVTRAVVDPSYWYLTATVTDRATGLRVRVVHRLRRSLVRADVDAEEVL